MIGLFLDALVIMGLVMFLSDDGESPPLGTSLITGFAISVLFVALQYVWPLHGWLMMGTLLPLMAATAGGVLWIVFDVEPIKAMVGGGLFLIDKVVVGVAFLLLLGGLSTAAVAGALMPPVPW